MGIIDGMFIDFGTSTLGQSDLQLLDFIILFLGEAIRKEISKDYLDIKMNYRNKNCKSCHLSIVPLEFTGKNRALFCQRILAPK